MAKDFVNVWKIRCACDVPAHNYTYSFEPKSDWSSVYASSSEIKGYFQSFCDKYGLFKYIKTLHKVDGARWIEAEGNWKVTIQSLVSGLRFDDHCHILINAGGHLNNWAWPDIPGLEEFEGQLIHSANWNMDISLESRKVGLIGSGQVFSDTESGGELWELQY